MADESAGSGFGWGLVFGLVLGAAAGYFLASEPGKAQVDVLRARTVELTGNARRAATDPEHPVRRAIQDGIQAAKQRREELASRSGGWQRPDGSTSDEVEGGQQVDG
jgi:hypothetical protein